MKKYSWLFFDADGTLFDFDAAQENAIEKTFASLNVTFNQSYHAIYSEINGKIWAQFERKEIAQKEIPIQRFKLFFKAINIQSNPEQASRLYLNFLSEGHQLRDGAEQLIESLYSSFDLLLITNGLKSVQRPRFSKSPITKYFKEIIISEEVGFAKPHVEIFDYTFDKIGNPPKESVLIIGDNPGSDILGGQKYGIDTCWYNTNGNSLNAGIKATYEIKDLKDLISIVG
jgi:2-haloacid dehalogenase